MVVVASLNSFSVLRSPFSSPWISPIGKSTRHIVGRHYGRVASFARAGWFLDTKARGKWNPDHLRTGLHLIAKAGFAFLASRKKSILRVTGHALPNRSHPAANNTASPSPAPAASSTTAANPRCAPQNQSPKYPPPADPPPHTGKRNVRTLAPLLPRTPAQSASLPPPSSSQSAPAAPPASPADKSPGPARESPPSAPRNTAHTTSALCHPGSNSRRSGPSPSESR